ncbi:phenylalanine--tRNA ligase subunit alpha, partial [bacterium]|nr:phenylalanine--tRNA ligase subunit alpha [bacterium]
MEQKILELRQRARDAIKNVTADLKELDNIRVKILGKKGELTSLLRGMSQLSAEDRPKIGKIVNEARAELEALIASKNDELKAKELSNKLASEKIDVTLPGRQVVTGNLHPLTLTLNRIKEIFLDMGYTIEEGPEVETDYYNFEALNLPKDHPA